METVERIRKLVEQIETLKAQNSVLRKEIGEDNTIVKMAPFVTVPARFVLLGDSITQMGFSVGGWAARLADQYVRRADVINRGFSGYNTKWALPTLPHVFPANGPQTDLVTVFYGANDCADPTLNARQHISIPEYRKNLRTIVDHIRFSCPSAAVIVITPPPLHAEKYRDWCAQRSGGSLAADWQPDRTLEVAGQYAAAALSTVESISGSGGNLNCIDLWSIMQAEKPGTWGEFLSDGLHLSPSGNEFLFEKIKGVIDTSSDQSLKRLKINPCQYTGSFGNSGSASDLLPQFPFHDKIDPAITPAFDA